MLLPPPPFAVQDRTLGRASCCRCGSFFHRSPTTPPCSCSPARKRACQVQAHSCMDLGVCRGLAAAEGREAKKVRVGRLLVCVCAVVSSPAPRDPVPDATKKKQPASPLPKRSRVQTKKVLLLCVRVRARYAASVPGPVCVVPSASAQLGLKLPFAARYPFRSQERRNPLEGQRAAVIPPNAPLATPAIECRACVISSTLPPLPSGGSSHL